MLKVIGIKHSTGEFNGLKFDNFNLHCVRLASDEKDEQGEITEVVKVKSSLFMEANINIGDDIEVYYDRFGRIISLTVN